MDEAKLRSMNHPKQSPRLSVGAQLAPFQLATLSHGTLTVPGTSLIHLQFRRFAGCPVCNLHHRSFAQGHARLEVARVQTIAFFHSPAELMQPYQGELPFATVPDPERHWYRRFGVERSAFAVIHPQVIGSALRGLISAPSNPFAGGSDQTGLPADFLINSYGIIVSTHYGRHADDQWSLDELLRLVTAQL
jgi:peroxiredoxin